MESPIKILTQFFKDSERTIFSSMKKHTNVDHRETLKLKVLLRYHHPQFEVDYRATVNIMGPS